MTVASRRRGDRASSALDVAAAAEERVDAVTVEPLVPDRHVEIVSPDGTLRLFYNTSTLIRIALDHGGWLQPPHFREPMTASLQRRIEHLEGRRFRFEAVDRHARTRSSSGVHEGAVVIVDDVGHRSDGTSDGDPWRSAYAPPTMTQQHTTAAAGGHAGSSGGVLHRHVFFEQIISRFYFLNQAEVYVCPVCYAHYVSTRYVPALRQRGRRVEYVDDGHTAVVDPLDVLTHMQHVELRDARDGVPSNSNNDSGDNNRDNRDDGSRGRRRRSRSIRSSSSSSSSSHDADGRGDEGSGADDDDDDDVALASRSALVCVVFRRAQQWRRHMRVHHAVHAVSSNDYRLRDVLCSYHNAYNQLHEEAFAARVAAVGEAQPRAALTQQRYWQLNARYNVLRYNRVVAAVERAERATTAAAAAAAGTACIERCAFDDEAMTSSFAAATDEGDDDDDDFIVNDSDSGSVTSSSSSSSSAASREDGHADEDDVHGSDADTSSAAAAAADDDDDDGRRTSVAREHRRRRRQRDDDNSSSSSSTITSTDSDSDDSDGGVRMLSASSLPRRGGRCAVSQLYKQGLLAPTPSYMQRMSAEDRAFVERAAHRRVAASQLYDPVMHRDRRERRGGGGGAVSALLQRSAEDVDDDEDDDKAHEDDVDWDCIGGTLSLTRAQRVATRPPHEPRRTCVPRTTDTAPTVATADTDAAAAAATAAAAHTPPRLLLLDDASDMDGDASDNVTATTTTTAAAPSSSTRMTTAVTTYTTRLLTDEDDVM